MTIPTKRPSAVARIAAAVACVLVAGLPASPAYAARADLPDVRGRSLTAALVALSIWDSGARIVYGSWLTGENAFGDQVAWGQLPEGLDTGRFTVAGVDEKPADGRAVVRLGLTVEVPSLLGDTADAATQDAQAVDFAVAVPDGETGDAASGQSPAAGTVVGVTGDPVGNISVTLGAGPAPSSPAPVDRTASPGAGPHLGLGGLRLPEVPRRTVGIAVVGVLLLLLLLLVRGGRRGRRARRILHAAEAVPAPPRPARRSSRRHQRLIGVRRRAIAPTLRVDDN